MVLELNWNFWKIVGWMGNAVFASRFLVQWYATERRKQVVVPPAFWWLSLFGSLLLLIYALALGNAVFIFSYALTWIPYIRNLIIHNRYAEAHVRCGKCAHDCPPKAIFCEQCGERLSRENRPPINGLMD
jgi:lipid-A-disaccharide synthase-like uncharacterized protein